MSHSKPTIYVTFAEGNELYLSAKRYDADSSEWENNNIRIKCIDFKTAEVSFNVLTNILAQAGINLIRE